MKYLYDDILYNLDMVPSAGKEWGLIYLIEKLTWDESIDPKIIHIKKYLGNLETISKKFLEKKIWIEKETEAEKVPENFNKNIYPGAGSLTFATNTNIGVGTSAPSTVLRVVGNMDIQGSLTVNGIDILDSLGKDDD